MKNYTNSDIFNSFIEIAEKKGLVSLAEDSDSSKKALEKNPRADSLTKEKISKLYGIKPDSTKEMSYDNNIMEVAHPKPAFVHDAYDKLNGLVENNIERQNAILKIVNKKTNGLLMQHKHARDEMVRSLVRVANLLDNTNNTDLSSLADQCIQDLYENSVKKNKNSHIAKYKKAKVNMIKSLVKVANLLDSTNNIKLCNLADQCIEDLHKSSK